jgi:hypothetical protein
MDNEIKQRPTFDMIEVVSSQVKSIGHDLATNTLAVQFPDKKDGSPGSLYHYANFTEDEFGQFKNAESVGSFFINRIKKFPDLFPYVKIG